MPFLSWLFHRKPCACCSSPTVKDEISRLEQSIAENDKRIEAEQPIVDEAVRRTDDVYYKLRSQVSRAERRIMKTETDLFMKDLESGLRG